MIRDNYGQLGDLHSKQCGCPSEFIVRVGLGPLSEEIDVVTCLRCRNTSVYKGHVTEPNKGDVRVRYEERKPTPAALKWLDAFPRRICREGFEFVSASVQIDSMDELQAHVIGDATMLKVDRLVEAGIPGMQPKGVRGTAFKKTRMVCRAKDTATFRQWVEWSSNHPARELALDVLIRRPDLVNELLDLIGKKGKSTRAESLLSRFGKGHPAAIAWVCDEAERLKGMSSDALINPLCALADNMESIGVPELVPQLLALEAQLDEAMQNAVRSRFARIVKILRTQT